MDSSESDSDSDSESVDLCPEVTTDNFRTHKKSHVNKQDTLITEISARDRNENNVTWSVLCVYIYMNNTLYLILPQNNFKNYKKSHLNK